MKSDFLKEIGGWIFLFAAPVLLVLGIWRIIINAIKSIVQRKGHKAAVEAERNWASASGIQFFTKLATMINNNESHSMFEHPELKALHQIDQKSLNRLFEVTDPKYDIRFWFAVSVLHDRYEMEVKQPVGELAANVEAREGINLGSDEMLYEKFENCEWYELRRSRQRSFGYHGLGIRIPLGAGISYRAGQIQSIEPQKKGEYQLDGQGVLYVTNQRIIFIGLSENKVIALSAILDLEQFKDSVVIGKSRGKKPLIRFEMDDAALFSRAVIKLFQQS